MSLSCEQEDDILVHILVWMGEDNYQDDRHKKDVNARKDLYKLLSKNGYRDVLSIVTMDDDDTDGLMFTKSIDKKKQTCIIRQG